MIGIILGGAAIVGSAASVISKKFYDNKSKANSKQQGRLTYVDGWGIERSVTSNKRCTISQGANGHQYMYDKYGNIIGDLTLKKEWNTFNEELSYALEHNLDYISGGSLSAWYISKNNTLSPCHAGGYMRVRLCIHDFKSYIRVIYIWDVNHLEEVLKYPGYPKLYNVDEITNGWICHLESQDSSAKYKLAVFNISVETGKIRPVLDAQQKVYYEQIPEGDPDIFYFEKKDNLFADEKEYMDFVKCYNERIDKIWEKYTTQYVIKSGESPYAENLTRELLPGYSYRKHKKFA